MRGGFGFETFGPGTRGGCDSAGKSRHSLRFRAWRRGSGWSFGKCGDGNRLGDGGLWSSAFAAWAGVRLARRVFLVGCGNGRFGRRNRFGAARGAVQQALQPGGQARRPARGAGRFGLGRSGGCRDARTGSFAPGVGRKRLVLDGHGPGARRNRQIADDGARRGRGRIGVHQRNTGQARKALRRRGGGALRNRRPARRRG